MLSNGNRKTVDSKRAAFLSISSLIFFAGVVVVVLMTLAVMEPLASRSGGYRNISGSDAIIAATTPNTISIHDLALVVIDTGGWAEVNPDNSSVTWTVGVGIQNRSDHDERIDDNLHLGNGVTSGLIRLKVVVIDDDNEGCEPAKVAIVKRAPLAGGPKFLLRPKDGYSVGYEVTFRCTAAKPRDRKDATPWDYSFSATVHHEVLDGHPDFDPSDDVCPREPIPPKREIQDRGCGRRLRGQPFGPNVVDVVLTPPKKP
ncbi:MAG: hypothetical protein HY694_11445 [Deltaproteobacteria bacterium]|nr:hypothetical protein [Deltaproteobacteria bacterium]